VTATGPTLPGGLRERVLQASRRARAAGQPFPQVPEISGAEAYRRAAGALYQTLRGLAAGDWRRPAIRNLDVQGLVGHLTGVEDDVRRALAGDPEAGTADHIASTQPAAARQAGRDPARTLQEWRGAVDSMLAQVAGLDDHGAIVAVHGILLPLNALLVARAFELWTHDNDIRLSCGLPPAVPDPETLHQMTVLGASLLPFATRRAGLRRGVRVHLVLTGAGGGTWDVELGDEQPSDPVQASIVIDAVGFCRLVANRATPAELQPHITGDRDDVGRVLAAAMTLALD
jgi:uncharacterized protein (TIGR03083 family)